MTGLSKSIIEPQKIAPINLETPEDQVEMRSISIRQKGFNPHLATCAYSLLYCCTATVLSGISDCLPSQKPVLLAPNVQGGVLSIRLQVIYINMIMLTNNLFPQVKETMICQQICKVFKR